MESTEKTKAELLAEIQTLRDRLTTSEEMLQAIMQWEVDALVISTDQGPRVFTLQSADQSYRLLVEEMQQGAAILSTEGLILYCNKSFSELLQRPLEKLVGSFFQAIFSPQDVLLFQQHIQQAAQEKQKALEIFLVRQDGIEIPVYLSIYHLQIEDVSMNCVVITDLTTQKRHEQTLASERLARCILEQAGEAILVCDHTGQVIRVSEAASQLWGEPLLFQPFDALRLVYWPSSEADSLADSLTDSGLEQQSIARAPSAQVDSVRVPFSIQTVLEGKSYQGIEVELECLNGQVLRLVLNARPLADQSNHFRGAVVILTDITPRKQAEEALRQAKEGLEIRVAERTAELQQTIVELQQAEALITSSLKEKEVLLKEIHHRVKNNLGIISSLLQMQIRRIENPQAAKILQDSQNRIASIALVHEKLYRSEDLANIDCIQYIRDLTGYLFDSYNISSNQVQLAIQVENSRLDIETTIPYGLIINELVSNALKHAFPDNRSGEVQVKLLQSSPTAQEPNQCISTLIVKDNGIGLPQDFDLKKAKTLGLKLVQGLATQIGATIEVIRQQGTEFRITFVRRAP